MSIKNILSMKKPKERAKKIAEEIVEDLFLELLEGDNITSIKKAQEMAKFCAVQCTEMLMQYLPSEAGNPPGMECNEFNREFWIEVQNEINNL